MADGADQVGFERIAAVVPGQPCARVRAALGVIPQALAGSLAEAAGIGLQDGFHHVLRKHPAQAVLAQQDHRLLQAADRLGGAVIRAAGDPHDLAHHQRVAAHEFGELTTGRIVVFQRAQQLRQYAGQARQAAHVEACAEQVQALEHGLLGRTGFARLAGRQIEYEAVKAIFDFSQREVRLHHHVIVGNPRGRPHGSGRHEPHATRNRLLAAKQALPKIPHANVPFSENASVPQLAEITAGRRKN